jgi:hypothetical protein
VGADTDTGGGVALMPGLASLAVGALAAIFFALSLSQFFFLLSVSISIVGT